LKTPNDQVKDGATSGIKVASEAAFKRDEAVRSLRKRFEIYQLWFYRSWILKMEENENG
jgi:hypothetical protein